MSPARRDGDGLATVARALVDGADERDEWQSKVAKQQTIPREAVDYAVGRPETTKEAVPLSFAQLQTEEQAREWYDQNHPEYPDEVLAVMARRLAIDRGWTSDDSKKGGFSVERKETTVSFD